MPQHTILSDEILAPLIATDAGRRAGWFFFGLAGLLALYALVTTPLNWYADTRLANARAAVSPLEPAQDQAALNKKISDSHLFGVGPAGQKTSSMPMTSLPLRLVGVIQSVPSTISRAIISESGETGKPYQVGDNVSGGVTIYSISNEGVILKNSGRLEKLPLQRSPLIFQGLPKKILQETK